MCLNDQESCVICQEDFSESNKHKVTLHCGHKYHKACLREWLKDNSSCPMCRKSTIQKITRNYSQLYYIQKLTEITTETAKLSFEINSNQINIWNRMITLYVENPFIFINEKIIAEHLKQLLVLMNEVCIKTDFVDIEPVKKNDDILEDLNYKISQIYSMLKHIE